VSKRDEAVKLLQHYFRLVADHAGVRLDWDNLGEIESIVDLIIDAAREDSK
jgi:hypothetical protein